MNRMIDTKGKDFVDGVKDYILQNGNTTEIGGNVEIDGNLTVNGTAPGGKKIHSIYIPYIGGVYVCFSIMIPSDNATPITKASQLLSLMEYDKYYIATGDPAYEGKVIVAAKKIEGDDEDTLELYGSQLGSEAGGAVVNSIPESYLSDYDAYDNVL